MRPNRYGALVCQDLEKVGTNREGIYITANLWKFAPGNNNGCPDEQGNSAFVGAYVYVLPWGQPDSYVRKGRLMNPDGSPAIDVQPASTLGDPGLEYLVDE